MSRNVDYRRGLKKYTLFQNIILFARFEADDVRRKAILYVEVADLRILIQQTYPPLTANQMIINKT